MKIDQEFIGLIGSLILRRFESRVKLKTAKSRLYVSLAYGALTLALVAVSKFLRLASYAYFISVRGEERTTLPKLIVLSLTKEQIYGGKSLDSLEKFFRESRFDNPEGEMIIESKSLRRFHYKDRLTITSVPLHLYIFKTPSSKQNEILESMKTGLLIFRDTFSYGRLPSLKALYMIFETSVWFSLRHEKFTLITTQSCMHQLPIAFQIPNAAFNKKMYWYSINSQPITRKGFVGKRTIFNSDLSRCVDMHYVWDLNSKSFLESNGIDNVSAVGSILFVEPKSVEFEFRAFNVAYFDITPFENPDTYYTIERMCTNLSKLIEVVRQMNLESQIEINLLLKPKRKTSKSHSRRYIEMVELFEKEGNLQVVRPEINLYGFISKVDCVIGVPFTSPVVVGRELGVASGYIDFYKDDYLIPEIQNGFPVILDELELMSWIKECLKE
jgi:hypothetical protein